MIVYLERSDGVLRERPWVCARLLISGNRPCSPSLLTIEIWLAQLLHGRHVAAGWAYVAHALYVSRANAIPMDSLDIADRLDVIW